MADNKEKLIAVLQYLEDWDKLTRAVVKDVAQYGMGLLVHQHEVEQLPEIRLDILDAIFRMRGLAARSLCSVAIFAGSQSATRAMRAVS